PDPGDFDVRIPITGPAGRLLQSGQLAGEFDSSFALAARGAAVARRSAVVLAGLGNQSLPVSGGLAPLGGDPVNWPAALVICGLPIPLLESAGQLAAGALVCQCGLTGSLGHCFAGARL